MTGAPWLEPGEAIGGRRRGSLITVVAQAQDNDRPSSSWLQDVSLRLWRQLLSWPVAVRPVTAAALDTPRATEVNLFQLMLPWSTPFPSSPEPEARAAWSSGRHSRPPTGPHPGERGSGSQRWGLKGAEEPDPLPWGRWGCKGAAQGLGDGCSGWFSEDAPEAVYTQSKLSADYTPRGPETGQ